MEDSKTKKKINQETEKACVSVERIESTLLSSFVKKGKETSNKRNCKPNNKRKTEEEICSKSGNTKYSRGWVHCEEEEKGKKTRKRKSKRQQKDNKVEVDDALRLQRRTRYLLIKMKMQQNLIDAYATEGWKGQSREKIRPDKELERARTQILNCKLGLRDAIRQLDLLSSVGSIEEEVIAPDGSIHHDNIFCAECKSREAFADNDIILCDGTCNRAFHQKCLDPPLETENIPPGDQGWFCKFCDCKMEIIDTMNAQIGTHFPVDSIWQDIFKEEASLPIGSEATVNNEADWPSDDSEDDDYDPEMRENGGGNSSNVSGDGGDNDEESSSTSVSLSSDGVALSTGSWEGQRFSNMMEQGETSNEETVCGPRQRRTVDYTQLYYEMFGKEAGLQEQGSEDEDWGPTDRRKRRKESDGVSTFVTMCESSKKDQVVVELPEQSERDFVSAKDKVGRRPMFRLPRAAVEKLRQVFAENELPSKAVRDSLSKELSLDPEKVSKWFKNARYMALRNRKTESVKQPEDSKTVSGGESGAEAVMGNNTDTNEVLDTLDESVPPGFSDFAANHKTNSPYNNNQEEIQQANVTFPTPTDESQQHVEQNDSSFTQVLREELSSEMSLKTGVEEKETDSKMMEEEEFEAVMETICRSENKLLDLTQRLERFKTPKGRKKLGRSSSCLLEEDSVVYVPIAEIKENS
ncbi:Pathogenesis-related homeodomain protein [Cardamine amara subsp. amara]|uniref:Pathogenesis-related homeodomain protein n=1 Tax=Cardamine amara subsp. amara TaxID=228776 RepID=A0ABD1AV40_CARAN